MSDRLTAWEARIIRWGIFLVSVAFFADYILRKLWSIASPWFH